MLRTSPNPPPRPRPSDAARAALPWPSAVHALGVAAALYPLFFAAAYYGEYLLAWLHLGHAPAPSLNDPKGIHPWLHTAVVVLFLGLPGAVVVSVALTFGALRFELASHARVALHIGISLASWALLWTLLSCDALQHINTWWAD
jgi:hypothetical protein